MSASQQKSRRALSAQRRAAADARQAAKAAAEAEAIPPVSPADIIREGDRLIGLSAAGLECVRVLAERGAPVSYISSVLGLPHKIFKRYLDKCSDDDPIRMNWEAGHSRFEHRVIQNLMAHSAKNFVAAIFIAKAKCGLRENDPQVAQTNNVQLVLPRAYSAEEYYRMFKMKGPFVVPVSADVQAQREAERAIRALPAPAQPVSESMQTKGDEHA